MEKSSSEISIVISESADEIKWPESQIADVKETPLEILWDYSRDPQHLTSFKHELAISLPLTFFSGSAALYGFIAYPDSKDLPLWKLLSNIICTSICPALTYFNSTREFVTLELARILPEQLHSFSDTHTWWENFWDTVSIVVVSAVSSIGLTTTSLTYPKFSSQALQILWLVYIQLCNTALHALPAKLVALKHWLYSVIFKPFFWASDFFRNCSLTPQERQAKDIMIFERREADQLCQHLCEITEAAFGKIIQESFEWNWFAGKPSKWMSYVKQLNGPINSARSLNLTELLSLHPPKPAPVGNQSGWFARVKRCGGWLIDNLSYVGGMFPVGNSCNGYSGNAFLTMVNAGLSELLAGIVAGPAIYLLFVLLAHIGGTNMQKDVRRILGALTGEDNVPLHAKMHTKLFVLLSALNVYIALFSNVAAIKVVDEDLDGSVLKDLSLFCAKYGIMYLSFSSVGEFHRYLSQWVRFWPGAQNQPVAEFEVMKDDFKRRLYAMKPEKLAESLTKYLSDQYTDEQVKIMLSMTKAELRESISFKKHYHESVLAKRNYTRKLTDCLPVSIFQSPEQKLQAGRKPLRLSSSPKPTLTPGGLSAMIST